MMLILHKESAFRWELSSLNATRRLLHSCLLSFKQ